MTPGEISNKMIRIVQSGAEAAKDVRALIIDALGKHAYRPVELFRALEGPGVSEARLKNALDALIDERCLELTPDRFLKLRPDHSGATR